LSDVTSGLSPRLRAVQRELQERWQSVLRIPEGARRLRYASAALRPAVMQQFEAPSAGWDDARYLAPDVMIEADSVDGIHRGDYRLVLGEVHLSNTLACSAYVAQHPDLDELVELVTRDLPGRRVVPALPNTIWPQRSSYQPVLPEDYRYWFSADAPPASSDRTLRAADLLVEPRGEELVVVHRDGRYEGEVAEFMGLLLTMLSTSMLQILPRERHLPRIMVDDVIVARESWSWAAAELGFAKAKKPLDRWLGAQEWRREHDLPRYVFIKVAVEPKPIFVDFYSTIYVETLARCIRRAMEADGTNRVDVTEMLPDVEHAWLSDAAGNRYTSELRLVMLDARRGA
jgi:hypothetical protein